MADAKKTEEAAAEPAPAKSKKGLMIAVVAIVLVLVVGGAAAFFMMKSKPVDEGDEEGDEPTTKVEKARKAKRDEPEAPPVFVKLEPFTVKLQTEQQEAYLQATPELRVLDAHIGDKVKQYTPEIRHKVQLILIGKKASDISTPQGVQALANEMRVTINGIIEPPPPRKKGAPKESEPPGDRAGPDEPVQSVLFTQFIIQ